MTSSQLGAPEGSEAFSSSTRALNVLIPVANSNSAPAAKRAVSTMSLPVWITGRSAVDKGKDSAPSTAASAWSPAAVTLASVLSTSEAEDRMLAAIPMISSGSTGYLSK
ncbi:MAG: hypothetical protein WKF72_01470 [Nocardioidaceae bacterium]